MTTRKMDFNEILILVREIEDDARQAEKVFNIFSDDKNWNPTYIDQSSGSIEKFNFLDYDPRQISDKGLRASKEIAEKAKNLFYLLYEIPIRREKHDSILLQKEDLEREKDDQHNS